jgi:cell division protein FtsL
MYTVAVICIIIVIVVLILSVVTTSKAYTYKHTVDPLDDNLNLDQETKEDEHNLDQKKAKDQSRGRLRSHSHRTDVQENLLRVKARVTVLKLTGGHPRCWGLLGLGRRGYCRGSLNACSYLLKGTLGV